MKETKRRDFLKILGIGSAAGVGCRKTPPEPLAGYAVPPEEMVRGHALWYRTTCRECPAGCGIEARVREGRIHKVEGNPEHPVNAGGLCARGQAAVQGLYNPDRLRTPTFGGKPVSWEEALNILGRYAQGATVITGCVTGAMEEAIARFGAARHIRYEPLAYENVRAANRACFGIDWSRRAALRRGARHLRVRRRTCSKRSSPPWATRAASPRRAAPARASCSSARGFRSPARAPMSGCASRRAAKLSSPWRSCANYAERPSPTPPSARASRPSG